MKRCGGCGLIIWPWQECATVGMSSNGVHVSRDVHDGRNANCFDAGWDAVEEEIRVAMGESDAGL